MNSSAPTVIKSSIILESPADWHEWMIVINLKAESGEIKQLIDPDLTTEPIPLKEPDRPNPSDIKEGVTTTVALTAVEREEYRFRREDYKIELVRYRQQREALNSLKDFIITSVARQHLSYLEEKTTVYQMLTALKKRVAPTDRARKMELARKYRDLQRGAVNQQPDRWLLDWEKTYADAERLKLPEVQEERPLYDFLNAIRSIDTAFTAGREAVIEERIRKGEGLPSVYDMIEEYRNHQRISQATSNAFSYSHSAFATFQGESPNTNLDDERRGRTRTWNKCVCGEIHSFKECPYLIEKLRAADWSPSVYIEKEIDEKLSKIPKLKAAVDRAQREMNDLMNKQKPPPPPKKPPEKPQEMNDMLEAF
jgi:hypothetical protein